MPRKPLVVGLVVLLVASGAVAAAAPGRRVLHNTRTFVLASRTTRTFALLYPDALKYGDSTYSGKVRLRASTGGAHRQRPSLAKVRVLSSGSCVGGSEFCARVRNGNARGTASTRVRITATTVLPPGNRR